MDIVVVAPTLRLALTMAKEGGVTASRLAAAAGIEVATAATFLGRYRDRGLLRVAAGKGIRNSPCVYITTLPGACRLERFDRPVKSEGADFGPLLECFGFNCRVG